MNGFSRTCGEHNIPVIHAFHDTLTQSLWTHRIDPNPEHGRRRKSLHPKEIWTKYVEAIEPLPPLCLQWKSIPSILARCKNLKNCNKPSKLNAQKAIMYELTIHQTIYLTHKMNAGMSELIWVGKYVKAKHYSSMSNEYIRRRLEPRKAIARR